VFLLETVGELVDNGEWEAELWDEAPNETTHQSQQCKAHNQKLTEAHKKRVQNKGKNNEEELHCHCHYNCLCPGRVPDGMGVVTVAQYPERDNTFYGLLSRHFYYSVPSNHVYAGKAAVDAQWVESVDDQTHLPDATCHLYNVVNH
jgi:hypothetical protein